MQNPVETTAGAGRFPFLMNRKPEDAAAESGITVSRLDCWCEKQIVHVSCMDCFRGLIFELLCPVLFKILNEKGIEMITVEDCVEQGNTAPALFSSPECPQWAKCVVINEDATIVFFDAVPQGYDEVRKNWIFPSWKFIRCYYSSLRGSENCSRRLLIREAENE